MQTSQIVGCINKEAREIVAENNRILKSIEDKRMFVHAILNPPTPNAALKKGYMNYKKFKDNNGPGNRNSGEKHNRKGFSCGQSLLDVCIQRQASQDVKRNLSICYVLNDTEESRVMGYYTLSSNAVDREELPEVLAKRLPPGYSDIPTALLGSKSKVRQ